MKKILYILFLVPVVGLAAGRTNRKANARWQKALIVAANYATQATTSEDISASFRNIGKSGNKALNGDYSKFYESLSEEATEQNLPTVRENFMKLLKSEKITIPELRQKLKEAYQHYLNLHLQKNQIGSPTHTLLKQYIDELPAVVTYEETAIIKRAPRRIGNGTTPIEINRTRASVIRGGSHH